VGSIGGAGRAIFWRCGTSILTRLHLIVVALGANDIPASVEASAALTGAYSALLANYKV